MLENIHHSSAERPPTFLVKDKRIATPILPKLIVKKLLHLCKLWPNFCLLFIKQQTEVRP